VILFFGTRLSLEIIPPGSLLAESHIHAQLQASGCHARGAPRVYYLELGTEEVVFRDESVAFLATATRPVGWHRVGAQCDQADSSGGFTCI